MDTVVSEIILVTLFNFQMIFSNKIGQETLFNDSYSIHCECSTGKDTVARDATLDEMFPATYGLEENCKPGGNTFGNRTYLILEKCSSATNAILVIKKYDHKIMDGFFERRLERSLMRKQMQDKFMINPYSYEMNAMRRGIVVTVLDLLHGLMMFGFNIIEFILFPIIVFSDIVAFAPIVGPIIYGAVYNIVRLVDYIKWDLSRRFWYARNHVLRNGYW